MTNHLFVYLVLISLFLFCVHKGMTIIREWTVTRDEVGKLAAKKSSNILSKGI